MIKDIDYKKYTLIKIPTPESSNINDLLQWFGFSLGLFSKRDKDRSCFRIFIELLKASKEDKLLSSDEIASLSKLSRATVIHHINKLIESGIVVSVMNRYKLRRSKLSDLIDDLEKDILNEFEKLKRISKRLDILLRL